MAKGFVNLSLKEIVYNEISKSAEANCRSVPEEIEFMLRERQKTKVVGDDLKGFFKKR